MSEERRGEGGEWSRPDLGTVVAGENHDGAG